MTLSNPLLVVLESWTVKELTALVSLFIGLVGILVGLHLYQKQQTLRPHARWQRLERWLEAQNLQLPALDDFIGVINKRLKDVTSEDWRDLRLSHFLPGTEPPQFEITNIVNEDSRTIEFQCVMEWPMCTPGMEVELIETKSKKKVSCWLQVEWMVAQLQVTFSKSNSTTNGSNSIAMSVSHMASPLMGLSCSINQQDIVEDHEKLASSVAHGFHEMFAAMSLHDEVPSNEPPPCPVPTVLVSAPVEEQEVTPNGVTTTAVEVEEATTTEDKLPADGNEKLAEAEGSNGDSPHPSTQDEGFIEDLSEQDIHPPQQEEGEVKEAKEEEENEQVDVIQLERNESLHLSHDTPPNHQEDIVPPISPTWKRSSSYEQLQQIDPEEVSLDRSGRALTLSMAGSETESIYGADDRIPSTLVFEVSDSVKVRHIVALNPQHASKLRRHFSNAQKLHIYNDHCFIATHIRHKCDCAVCRAKISGRFGKQAYNCRGCGMMVHKQCHYKVEGLCTSSDVHNMKLIYPDRTSTTSS